MKRIFLLIAAIATLTFSAMADNIVKCTYDFGEFYGVTAGFTHNITVTKGKSNKIEVKCPEKYVKYLEYGVTGGILKLNLNLPRKMQRGNQGEIQVTLQMQDISKISLSGAAKMNLFGEYNGKTVLINLSGASELDGESFITAENLRCELSGASECNIAGTFDSAIAEISGASELGLNASANTLVIEASGSSECSYESSKKAESVYVQCSGASEVELSGITNEIHIQCSGSSEVDAKQMTAQTAQASASGASEIKVSAQKKLDLRTSGASEIKYYGKASEIFTSGKSITKGW